MIARIVSFIIALAAAAAAAAVLVVSAAFAVYAFLRTYVGPAGASACIVLFAAFLLGLISIFMYLRIRRPQHRKRRGDAANGGLADRLGLLLGDKPFVAAGAAVAAGLIAWRNPAIVSTLLKLADSMPAGRRKR